MQGQCHDPHLKCRWVPAPKHRYAHAKVDGSAPEIYDMVRRSVNGVAWMTYRMVLAGFSLQDKDGPWNAFPSPLRCGHGLAEGLFGGVT